MEKRVIVAVLSIFNWISETRTEEWYVAPWGITLDEGCGDMENPCMDLLEILVFDAEDGATVYIQTDESHSMPMEMCVYNEMPIQVGVTIIGINGRPVLTCSEAIDKYSIFNFNFGNPESQFEIENIAFMGSSITLSDSTLIINDCIFNQTAIFLSSSDILNKEFYFNDKTSMDDVNIRHLETLYNMNFQCSWVTLEIHNTFWFPDLSNHHQIKVDQPRYDTLFVMCDYVDIFIYNTQFNNQKIQVYSDQWLNFEFKESIIQGVGDNEIGCPLPGGITLYFNEIPEINIVGSTFKDLVFQDPLLMAVATYVLDNSYSALSLRSITIREPIEWPDPSQPNIVIDNCTFVSNFQAIKIHVDFIEYVKVQLKVFLKITNSIFEGQRFVHDGSALWVNAEQNILRIEYESCLFKDNIAGYLKKNVTSKYLGTNVTNFIPMEVLKFKRMSDTASIIEIYTQSEYKTIFFGNLASGGAMYLTYGNYKITSCFYIENEASLKGGSMYISKEAEIIIKDTEFVTSDDGLYLSAFHLVISSNSLHVVLKNISIFVSKVTTAKTSFLSHASDKDFDSLHISDAKFICPRNTYLHTKNSSVNIFQGRGNRYFIEDAYQYLSFKSIRYECRHCDLGHYTYGHGSMEITFLNNTPSVKDHRISLPNINCYKCPWGGKYSCQ